MAAQPTAPPETKPTAHAICGSDHKDASEKFNSFPLPSARAYLWRDLYRQAIFESDRTRIPERIREAERALMHRERELCRTSGSAAERETVVTALNCLEALRACIDIHESPKSHCAPLSGDTEGCGAR
jgi:hypothetical protein